METHDSLEGQVENINFLEQLYQDFEKKPDQFDPSWPQFFKEMKEKSALPAAPSEERIVRLKEAYQRYGHLFANIDPLKNQHSELNLRVLGFRPGEEQQPFPTLGLLSSKDASLSEIQDVLRKRYCRTVGFEFKDFTERPIEEWIEKEIESGRFDFPFAPEEKILILTLLTHAETLESFLHTKHVGKKRFSLEGGESLIPMLSLMIAKSAEEGVEEIYIGMSHRGRLNVLANILNKPLSSILKDFDDEYDPLPIEGMGDIRYHKGHANESVITHKGKKIGISVTSNPSHLESIDPVVEGQTHAKQFLKGDEANRSRIIPLLMHGDGALAGQGIVYETLQMSKLPGFETGGTLHFVINNQIGFTTSPKEGRSTRYCTDIARTFGAPVIHVNAEDTEACVHAAFFALELRQKFHCDVFIDFNCYRKYGHNEGDEPAFTQPEEYQTIRNKRSIRSLYLDALIKEGIIDKKRGEQIEEEIKEKLKRAYETVSEKKTELIEPEKSRSPLVDTKVNLELLKKVAKTFVNLPSDFHIHPKLKTLMKERADAVLEDKPFDWGTAEFYAYGTLCSEGIPVRLVGQDSGRGTFSHRHALLVDQEDGHPYYPLAHFQGRFEVLNTCLSEAAALGFEYGYSLICTKGLTIWEAQFGDFANSAQVIIDQYLSSGEQKWGQKSNLVLFLPHGFEGQGPEHSSARLERFLSLAAQDNLQIVVPTLPSQIFHLLRRQVNQQKPLIVLTPKAYLRHPSSTSKVSDLINGSFRPIIDSERDPKVIRRLLFCAGKIFFDLEAKRQKEKREEIAIIRLEQLYPLDQKLLSDTIARYGNAKEIFWVQEEPQNMGAWTFISPYFSQIQYAGRERSATPATGFYMKHNQELEKIYSQVFQ